MNEIEAIEQVLRKTGRRYRLSRAWRGMWYGVLMGSLIWLGALLAYKLAPIPFRVLPVAGWIALAVVPIGFVVGGWRRVSLMESARWVDHEARLQERLSSAVELSRKPEENEWRKLVVKDAAGVVPQVNARELLPWRLPRSSRWALLVLALGAGLGFVPEYRSERHREAQAEEANLEMTGKQLASLTRRQIEKRPPSLPPTEKALKEVEELGQQLSRGKLKRDEALKDLAKMTSKLEQQADQLRDKDAIKKLRKAAQQPSGPNASAEELMKQIKSLQDRLKQEGTDPEALENLKRQLEELMQRAAAMNSQSPETKAQGLQAMEQSMSELMQQAMDFGAQLPDLQSALDALKIGNFDRVMKDLENAQVDLEKMLEMAKALKQMEMNLQKLGENLGEQLDQGQATAAQSTLKKLARQLEETGIGQEALERIRQEVSDALKPAEGYGKVPEHLQEALAKMQTGQEGAAAQSLREAAKELEQLAQQAGDLQALLESMKNLQTAQMCVGNGMSWGQCQSQLIKAGNGGKPGRGVGTWADESTWANIPQFTEGWDNSGLNRPDMEARGQTDRGEPETPNGMVPDKVKGQFTPGESMPSITLKGLNIRGESRVGLQEAVSAAQSEAASALNQQKVPRAYQGAVRDYFDDLKE